MKPKIILFSLLSVLSLTGCGSNSNPPAQESEETPFELNENIKKITVTSDDVGIYSVVIYLSNKIAEKGDLKFIYKGPKNSPQKDSIIATFTLNYWTESTGYEVRTKYNGDLYQNFSKLTEVKFNMTFGASTRAGDVTVYYTPNGGSEHQIFYSDKACYYHN